MGFIVEQPVGLLDDHRTVCPYEQCRAGFYRFRSLRVVTENQHRFAECRRFLLDTAGIGQNEVCVIQRRDEIDIVERRQERYARMAVKATPEDIADVRVGMDRHQYMHIVSCRDLG